MFLFYLLLFLTTCYKEHRVYIMYTSVAVNFRSICSVFADVLFCDNISFHNLIWCFVGTLFMIVSFRVSLHIYFICKRNQMVVCPI